MSAWLLLIVLPILALLVADWRRTLRRTRHGVIDFTGHRFTNLPEPTWPDITKRNDVHSS